MSGRDDSGVSDPRRGGALAAMSAATLGLPRRCASRVPTTPSSGVMVPSLAFCCKLSSLALGAFLLGGWQGRIDLGQVFPAWLSACWPMPVAVMAAAPRVIAAMVASGAGFGAVAFWLISRALHGGGIAGSDAFVEI